MKLWCSILLVMACATVASAQALPIDRWTPPLPTESARQVADVTSTGLVAAQLATATWNAWHADDRPHALKVETARLATAMAATEILKRLVNRDRPLHQDQKSWPSEHTTIAFALVDGAHPVLSVSLAVGAGVGRVEGGWHYLTDVLSGALLGYAINYVIR